MTEVKELQRQLAMRWHGISAREQWLSACAGISLIVWFVWLVIVTPLNEQQLQAGRRLAASQTMMQLVQKQANDIRILRAGGAKENPSANRPIDQIAHQTARQQSITVTRVQPRGELLDIDIENLPFNTLMGWLLDMETLHQIEVRDIQIDTTEISGTVRVSRLVLARS